MALVRNHGIFSLSVPQIEVLKSIASKRSDLVCFSPPDKLVQESLNYLRSDAAQTSIDLDPYWPKWNSPWWHMLLLDEMGLAQELPELSVERMIKALNFHYLHFFPITENEIPENAAPLSHIACHCQLGEMHQLLSSYGVNVDVRLPWLRQWYVRYQLLDGGLNCDESAYLKDAPKSSIVSSLPPLEAILACGVENLSEAELNFLDRGARYLLERKLSRSLSSGRWIDESWLQLTFPRFYEYDILRGLNFVFDWCVARKKCIAVDSIIESVINIDRQFPDGNLAIQRSIWAGKSTRYLTAGSKQWSQSMASGFPLLTSVSKLGATSAYLSSFWSGAKDKINSALDLGLIVDD